MVDVLAVYDGSRRTGCRPTSVGLGIAVDMERKDGTRGLVVPVIKGADTMDFAAFHATYESLIEKARTNKLMPDDFSGGTIQLTNPGGLGTVASVPRLMAGPGNHHRRRRHRLSAGIQHRRRSSGSGSWASARS